MVRRAWRQVRWSVEQRGVWGTLRAAMGRVGRQGGAEVVNHPFDEEFGVETSGFIGGGVLAGEGRHGRFATAYHGIPPSRLRRALEMWRATDGTLDIGNVAFVDIGCGKGRAVMLATEMGFREVLGVELSGELVAVAERNLERWRELGLAKCSVRVVQGDAIAVDLPRGPLLVYLYNPFQATVMRLLLERLAVIAAAEREQIDVLYVTPSQTVVFAEFPQFKKIWSEMVALSEEDSEGDLVAMAEDRCELFRLQ
jgi:SAM-dependent methyltransferase